MKNIIYFVLFGIIAVLIPTTAEAQQNYFQVNENGEAEINWEELEKTLAPLEEVQLPEPRLSTGEDGEKQTYLAEGEVAPWDGVLLNPPAVAFIITEYEASFERAEAALEQQRSLDFNRLKLEVGQLRLRLKSEMEQNEIIVEGLRSELERQQQIHDDYIEEQTGGFWNSGIGKFVKYGLIVLAAAAVGYGVGAIVTTVTTAK